MFVDGLTDGEKKKDVKNRRFLSPALAPVLNLILLSCPLQGQITLRDGWAIRFAKEVKARGEQVSSVTYSASGWYSTGAPATVLAVLVKHGVYPDPYFGTNLATIPGYNPDEWIRQDMPKDSPFNVPWWYRTQFALPLTYKGTNIRLHLDGINYKAVVWLNGHMVADNSQVEGPYRHFDLDITRYARPGETNCLALEITPPTGTDLTIRWMQGTRTPPDRDTGIWYDVSISSSGPVRMAIRS
jgi:exo-1,4-beta-D-glucosaminidase